MMRRHWAAAALVILAALCAQAGEKLDPERMKALGFVPYRHWWVTPSRHAELIAELPAILVQNACGEPLRVSVDGAAPVDAAADDGAAVPVTPGRHRVRLASRRGTARPVTVTVRKGYETRIEVIAPEAAPSVLPRHERKEGDDGKPRRTGRPSGWRTEKGTGYEIRYHGNEPKRGVIKHATTREGNVIFGLRRAVRFDDDTWRMRGGALVTRRKVALVLTERVGVLLVSDPQIDEMIYTALFRTTPLEDIPLSRDHIETLARLGGEQALALCLKTLDSELKTYRRTAAEALADLATPRHVPLLKRKAKLETEGDVERALEETIAALEARGAIDALVAKASAGDDRARMAALDELREHAADVPTALYRDVLATADNPAFREIGAGMLAKADTEAAVPLLAALLKDPEAGVRKRAVQSLGTLKALEAAPQIIARLDDEAAEVRSAAAVSLAELGVADAVPALLTRLEDDDKWVRNAVSVALAQIGRREGILSVDAGLAERAEVVAGWKAWWAGDETTPEPPADDDGKPGDETTDATTLF